MSDRLQKKLEERKKAREAAAKAKVDPEVERRKLDVAALSSRIDHHIEEVLKDAKVKKLTYGDVIQILTEWGYVAARMSHTLQKEREKKLTEAGKSADTEEAQP